MSKSKRFPNGGGAVIHWGYLRPTFGLLGKGSKVGGWGGQSREGRKTVEEEGGAHAKKKKNNNQQTDGELGRRRNERRNLPSHLLRFHPRAATGPQTVWGHARVIIVFERDGRAVTGDCTL